MVMETSEILRRMVNNLEQDNESFSKIITVLAHGGAFNMKGQEMEQVLAVMLHDFLQNELNQGEPKIVFPQSKTGPDLAFAYTTEGEAEGVEDPPNYEDMRLAELKTLCTERGLQRTGNRSELIARLEWADEHNRWIDLKFYGGADRAQMATISNLLDEIRTRFEEYHNRNLLIADRRWLIEKINSEIFYDTLAIVCNKPNEAGETSIFVYHFNEINLSCLLNYDSDIKNRWKLKRVAAERRIEIHIPVGNGVVLEISAGGNALNRGIWINKINEIGDLNYFYDNGILNRIYEKTFQMPNFDPQEYVRFKGENTMQFAEEHWD